MTKRVLHGLTLSKIAAVDFPCQEPAQALIIKRASDVYDKLLKGKYSDEQRKTMAGKEAMSDGSYPIADAEDLGKAIKAVGRGRNNSHAAIRRHVTSRAKALGLSDQIPDTWKEGGKIGKAICEAITKSGVGLEDPDGDEGAQNFDTVLGEQSLTQNFWDQFYKGTNALQASLVSILKDDAVTDKGPMVTQSLQEFADYIEEILPGEVGKALAAGVAAMFAGAAGPTDQGDTMSDAIKKALGLAATATEADILKAMEEKDTKLKAAEKDAKVAKMSDKHKAFMAHPDAKMPEGGKDKFGEMTAAERDKHMADNPVEDEDEAVEKALKAGDAFKTPEGAIVLKRKVGADVFAILKANNDRGVAQGAELAKMREDKIAKEYVDLAKELGFAESFAPTLRKALQGADDTSRAALLKEMKALRAQAEEGGVFKELGGHGGTAAGGTAEGELMAKRDALMAKDPKLSKEQAFSRVWKDRDNAPIVKRYRQEQASAN